MKPNAWRTARVLFRPSLSRTGLARLQDFDFQGLGLRGLVVRNGILKACKEEHQELKDQARWRLGGVLQASTRASLQRREQQLQGKGMTSLLNPEP